MRRSKYYRPDDEDNIVSREGFMDEICTHWAEINPDGSVTAEVRINIYKPDGSCVSAVRKIRTNEKL